MKLTAHSTCFKTSLEDAGNSVSNAVSLYVEEQTRVLEEKWNATSETRTMKKINNTLIERAEGTFLWVSLACKDL